MVIRGTQSSQTVDFLTQTAQKLKSFVGDFISKCDQIRRKLRIWSHLLKESLMEKPHFLCSVRSWIYNFDKTVP